MLGDEGVQVMLDSPLVAQLRELEIKKNAISVSGASELAKVKFERLQYLSVSGNPLGEQGLARLRTAFPQLQLVGRGAREEE